MNQRYAWTQFAVPLGHFREKEWMVYDGLCSTVKNRRSPMPGTEHSRNSHALRVAVDVPSVE